MHNLLYRDVYLFQRQFIRRKNIQHRYSERGHQLHFPYFERMERAFIRISWNQPIYRTQDYFYGFWQRGTGKPGTCLAPLQGTGEESTIHFGTRIKKGYQTDRAGYTWNMATQYPKQQYNEPNSYPYEIWQYYTLKQRNGTRNSYFMLRIWWPAISSDSFRCHWWKPTILLEDRTAGKNYAPTISRVHNRSIPGSFSTITGICLINANLVIIKIKMNRPCDWCEILLHLLIIYILYRTKSYIIYNS